MYYRRAVGVLLIALFAGCSQAPSRLEPPSVDPEAAASEAMSLYDSDKDGALNREELKQCPGMSSVLVAYDSNGNESVEREEIAARLANLLRHGTGGTQLSCSVRRKGRPLAGAEVVFEPEPYLGEEVKVARGTTTNGGIAEMSVPSESLPERLQGFDIVHYGTFKVRITHPTIKLPAKYNTATELGYETRSGDPYVEFNLTE